MRLSATLARRSLVKNVHQFLILLAVSDIWVLLSNALHLSKRPGKGLLAINDEALILLANSCGLLVVRVNRDHFAVGRQYFGRGYETGLLNLAVLLLRLCAPALVVRQQCRRLSDGLPSSAAGSAVEVDRWLDKARALRRLGVGALAASVREG